MNDSTLLNWTPDALARIRAYDDRFRRMVSLGERPRLSDDELARLLDTAFIASIGRNEGRTASFTLSFMPGKEARAFKRFKEPRPLTPASIVALAPALGRRAILLDRDDHGWCIAGIGTVPMGWLCIISQAPGEILVVQNDQTLAATFDGRLRSIQERVRTDVLEYLDPMSAHRSDWETINMALDISRMIDAALAHGNGGTILVVPTDCDLEAHLEIAHYCFLKPDEHLRELNARLRPQPEEEWSGDTMEQQMRDMSVKLARVAEVGRLTAVDGALVLNTDLEVIGFGAKITSPKAEVPIVVQWPDDRPLGRATVDSLTGTRHRSAACFAAANPKGVAIAISHDGPVTLFYAGRDEHEADVVVAVKHLEKIFVSTY